MKFVCDSCGVQYLISDEKIGSRGAKVRCKRCGHIILVKPPGEAPAPAPTGEESLSSGSEPFPERSGEGDELGRAFDRLLEGKLEGGGEEEEGEEEDEDGGETQVFNVEEMQRFRQETISQEEQKKIDAVFSEASSTGVVAQPAKPAEREEWYLAIHDEQVGPMELREVEEYWEKGEVGPRTLAWCQGMAEWTPIQQVPQLKYLLSSKEASAQTDSVAAAKEEWVTSGSSSLASLVEEELQAVASKPPPVAQETAKEGETERAAEDIPPWERDEVVSGEVARPAGGYFDSSLTAPTTDSGSPLPRKSGIVKPAYLSEDGGRRSKWKFIFAGGAGAIVTLAVVLAVVFGRGGGPQADDATGPASYQPKAPLHQAPGGGEPAPVGLPREQPPAGAAVVSTEPGSAGAATTPDAGTKEEGTIVVEKPRAAEEKSLPPASRPQVKKPAASGKSEKTTAQAAKPKGQEKPAATEAQPSPAQGATLSKEQILATMRNYVSAMKKCVNMQKERDPTVTGKMIVSFTIQPNGKTSDAQVQTSEHKGTFVASCILGVISGITFPAFSGPPVPVPNFPLKLGD